MDTAISGMITFLRVMSLQDEVYKGEDVDKATGHIQACYCHLQVCQAVPHDIIDVVCHVMKSGTPESSVPPFLEFGSHA